MRDITSHRDLDQRIDQLVCELIASSNRHAREARERAFASAASPKVGRLPQVRPARASAAPTELSELGERPAVARALCACRERVRRAGTCSAELLGQLRQACTRLGTALLHPHESRILAALHASLAASAASSSVGTVHTCGQNRKRPPRPNTA